MPATINDVARRAGVHKRTVTRVINNQPHVSEKLRVRVEAAIAELGFVPNVGAQRLATSRTCTIAMVLNSASADLIGPVVVSAARVVAKAGYTLSVVLQDPEDPAGLITLGNIARGRHADGLILSSPLIETDAEKKLRALLDGFPWVWVGGLDTPDDIPTVNAGDQAGAYTLTEHLLESGHRRLGYVSTPRLPFTDRLRGFEAALTDHELAVDSRYVVVMDDLTFEDGLSAGRRLLAVEPRPTAICAANDAAAAGVLTAVHEAGLRAPDDVSVAGFDDFPIAQVTHPALTTVRVPIDQISQAASALLIELINGQMPPHLHIRVPLSLVIRQSTGPCRDR